MAIQSLIAVGETLATELEALARRIRTGVVQVRNGRGGGAGTIWSADGLIVTNHHVVPGSEARVTLADRRSFGATVVAALPERDLAVLQIEASGLPALTPGDSNALRPGEVVMAVGHPLGVRGAVSLGIFSGFGPIEGRGNGRHMREALLADIELRPGNSGGPLVNARGEVVGINAMVMGPRTALAIPSATVLRLIGGRARRVLGVRVESIATPRTLADALQPGAGGSALIGRRQRRIARPRPPELLPGDIILAIDGHAIQEPGDLAWALTGASVGETATLRILRGGVPRDVMVRFA